MVEIFLAISGFLLISVTFWDVICTTLVQESSGPLTKQITLFTWKLFFIISGKKGTNVIMKYCGAFTLIQIFLFWMAIYWLGNALIYISFKNSLIYDTSSEIVDTVGKFYFTGYTISTLGLGDIKPNSDFFKIYTSVLSFSGFALITLAASYCINVTSDNVNKQVLAANISIQCKTPFDFIASLWNGKDFSSMDTLILSLTNQIIQVAQNIRCYPVIPNFHEIDRNSSLIINIAKLSESIFLIKAHYPENSWPKSYLIIPLENAIDTLMQSIKIEYISTSEINSIPSIPSEEIMQGLGGFSQNRTYYESIKAKRKMMLFYIEYKGFKWEDVWEA